MVQIPGLTPNQTVPWNQIPQGMYLNTPRDWSAGGLQRYSPQAATMGPMPEFNQGQMAAWQTRGAQKGGGPLGAGGVGGSTAPNYGRMGGTTTSAFAPNIQTGITVGPVMPQQIVQSEQNRLRQTQVAAPQGPVDYSPYMQHLNSLLSGQMNAAATDFGRDAAYANAQQMLGTQQARARAGTGWGGVALQQYGNQLGGQQQALAMLLSLLGQFGV